MVQNFRVLSLSWAPLYTHLIDKTINGLTHDDPSVKRKLRQTLIEGIETLKVVCPEEYLSGSTGKEIFENNSERVVDNQASVLGDTLKVIGIAKKSPQKRGKSNKKTDQDDEWFFPLPLKNFFVLLFENETGPVPKQIRTRRFITKHTTTKWRCLDKTKGQTR